MSTVFIFHSLSPAERSSPVEMVFRKFLETYQLACPEDQFVWGPSFSSATYSHVLLQSAPQIVDPPIQLFDQIPDEWIHSFLEADRYIFVTSECNSDIQANLVKIGSVAHCFFQDERHLQNYFSKREVVHITTGQLYDPDPFREPYLESEMDHALWCFLKLLGFRKYESITVLRDQDMGDEDAYKSLCQSIEHAKTVALSFAWEGRVVERGFGFQWY